MNLRLLVEGLVYLGRGNGTRFGRFGRFALMNNLLLVGRPATNAVTTRFVKDLPVSFGRCSVQVRDEVFAHPDTAVLVAAANPLNRRYSLVVIAGLEASATLRAAPYLMDKVTQQAEPYHGYYYRILKGQGSDAPGGALNYVVKGKMIGGFALIAYPAEYGNSGVMTFMVNHAGTVYQKDLGTRTDSTAKSIYLFDPDQTWKKADVVAP